MLFLYRHKEEIYIAIIVFLVITNIASMIRISHLVEEKEETDRLLRNLLSQRTRNATFYLSLYYNYTTLRAKYESLLSDYREILDKYNELNENYNALEASNEAIKRKYSRLETYTIHLTRQLAKLQNETMMASLIPYAFKRVLNYYEIYLIRDYVYDAVKHPESMWLSIQDIYNYVATNIRYTHDTKHLVVFVNYTVIDGKLVASNLEYMFVANYIQTPRETILYGHGDCDDQAVLVYAMIKYYLVSIYMQDTTLYIAKINMNDGYSHLAVFLPTGNGNLTIIDPAGKYLTIYISLMNSRPAYEELIAYSNYWMSHGGINSIYLYEVDVSDGSYQLVAYGSLYQVAMFLEGKE